MRYYSANVNNASWPTLGKEPPGSASDSSKLSLPSSGHTTYSPSSLVHLLPRCTLWRLSLIQSCRFHQLQCATGTVICHDTY